jgi:hypothetical protein
MTSDSESARSDFLSVPWLGHITHSGDCTAPPSFAIMLRCDHHRDDPAHPFGQVSGRNAPSGIRSRNHRTTLRSTRFGTHHRSRFHSLRTEQRLSSHNARCSHWYQTHIQFDRREAFAGNGRKGTDERRAKATSSFLRFQDPSFWR